MYGQPLSFWQQDFYIGWTWLTSGIGKLTGGFDASGYLQFAISEPVVKDGHLVYPFYVWF